MTLIHADRNPLLLLVLTPLFFAPTPAVASASASAQVLTVNWLPDYRTGEETCAPSGDPDAARTAGELGNRVEVPVDYSRPAGPQTSIYYWTRQEIRPELPFVVFAAGGPGASMHGSEFRGLDAEFNIVYFDPRGMNCSKPADRATYRDPAFYSSVAIARDIEEIRKSLGAPMISVYGHSYGTVVATIYGSLFPRSTRAVVLEGTIAHGGNGLYRAESTRALMQAKFDSYPEAQRERILELSRDPLAPPTWFSRAARFMMYLDEPFTKLDYWLDTVLAMSGDNLYAALHTFDDYPPDEAEFGFGLMLHLMISCQELGQDSPHASFYYRFDFRGRLIPDLRMPGAQDNHDLCRELGARTRELYSAQSYPIEVPVSYFQGETDGATPQVEALDHFSKVPRGFAQFFQLEKGGHQPGLRFLRGLPEDESTPGEQETNRVQRRIFAEAVLGRPVSSAWIDRFNSLSPLRWSYSASEGRIAQSGL